MRNKQNSAVSVIALVVVLSVVVYMCTGTEEKQPEIMTHEQMVEERLRKHVFPRFTHQIREKMNDPTSYESVSETYTEFGDHYILTNVFRGTNAMGGVVTQKVTAEVDSAGNIIRVIESGL